MKLQYFLEFAIPYVVHFLEILGTIIILISAVKAFYHYVTKIINPQKNFIKIQFAESIALALEFKLASEILKTVIIRSMKELYVLGAVIILRVILTFVIQWEIKTDKSGSASSKQSSGKDNKESGSSANKSNKSGNSSNTDTNS